MQTLSFLGVEDKGNKFIELSSSDEEDVSQRRRPTNAVIDRTLSRTSNISASTKLAFQTDASEAGFRVPTLLKRTTTDLSTDSQGSTSIGTERSLGDQGVRKGGVKSSRVTIHKRAIVSEKSENKRKMERAKEGRERAKLGFAGVGKGGFS